MTSRPTPPHPSHPISSDLIPSHPTPPLFTTLHSHQAIRTLIDEDVKTNAAARCLLMIEHYWRVRGVPGAKDYDQVVHRMFQRHNLRLPLTCAGNAARALALTLAQLYTYFVILLTLTSNLFTSMHMFSF